MTYAINTEFNGIEITFDSKPGTDIRDALKANGFRWHRAKKLWYAKNTEKRMEFVKGMEGSTESSATAWGGEHSDGYMGAIRWDGNKSGEYLHGSKLSKAIRDDLKAHGIKGVTISVDTYSMGQTITAKIKYTEADFIPFEEWFKTHKDICDFAPWDRVCSDENDLAKKITTTEYYGLPEADRERILRLNAQMHYDHERVGTLNQFCLDKYESFGKELASKVKAVNACINSYRYDDSNSMVDYFNTNFYYDLVLVEDKRRK